MQQSAGIGAAAALVSDSRFDDASFRGEILGRKGAVIRAHSSPYSLEEERVFGLGIIEEPEGEYRALSAVCTHFSCTVQYRKDLHEIWCACRNGLYDLNGRNISGPPPRPLEAFQVHVRGGEIVVSRKREA